MNPICLAWIASKVKAVAPALPAGDSTVQSPPDNSGLPNAGGGSMAIPGEVQPAPTRRKSKKKPAKVTPAGPIVVPASDDDGSSKGEDTLKSLLKRSIRAFQQ